MKKLFSLMLMLLVAIGIQAATPDKLYIVGQANVGIGSAGWVYTPATSGCVEMTKSGNKFTASVTLTGTAWFCFGEQNGSSWDDFNDNYSWRPSSNNFVPTAGTPVTMVHNRNNSFQLGAGEYTFTVDFSGTSPTFTLSGKADEVVITGYTVLGAKELFGGEGWEDAEVDMTESSEGVYTATLSNVALTAGTYEYKARANKTWGIAEFPESGNASFTIDEAGTYNVVFTLKVATKEISAVATKVSDEAPEPELYVVGNMTDWDLVDDAKMTKMDDGTYYYFIEDVQASETEPIQFKFVDKTSNKWYGSTNLEVGEVLGPDNFENIAVTAEGTEQSNFIINQNAKNVKLTLDLENMLLNLDADAGETVAAPENLYILGDLQGWNPADGKAQMTRTKEEDGKYKYEYTGAFTGTEKSYFSFTSQLSETSTDWESIASYRYGAYSADEAITADNTDPYDLKQGTNAFALPAGYYRIELTWKEDGPDLAMWVHTEEAPAKELYLTGAFADWTTNNDYKLEEADGKLTITKTLEAESTFKFLDNFGTWYGPAESDGNYWVTKDNHEGIALSTASGENNFYVEKAGEYTFTVDLENLTLSVSSDVFAGEEPEPEPYLYIFGNGDFGFGDGDWTYAPIAAGKADPMKLNDEGAYFWTGTLTKDSYFAFTFKDGADWDDFNTNFRFGPETPDTTPTLGEPLTLVHKDASLHLSPGEYTITVKVDGDQATLTVTGEVAEEPETELYLIGSFCGWEQKAKVQFEKVDNKFVLEGQEIEQYGQFKLIDNKGIYYGGNADGETFWITNAAHTGITLNNTDAGKNFYINDAGTYTFTVDLENLTLDVDGDFAELELKKFAALDEEVTYNNETYVMESTADWKGIQCWIGDASTTKGNYLKVTTDPASRLKIMAYYVNDGGSATLEAPEEAQAEYYLKLDPEKALQKVIIQTAVAGTVTFTSCAIVEEGPAQPEATPEHLYLIGDIISYQWSYQPIADGKAIEMTKNGDKFTWKGRIDHFSSFAFITQDGESWEDLNGNYRFGPEIEPSYPQMGEVIVMHRSGYAYSLEAGDYQFEVDFSGEQPTLTVTGTPDEKPAVEVPEHLYVLGTLNEDGWAPNAGLEMTKNENTFTLADVVVTATAGFSFTNKLAETDDAWDDIATSRYGAAEDRTVVEPDQFYQVVYGNNDNAFIVEPGTYTFVVTFNESDITLAVTGEADQPVIEVPEHLYILGDVNEAGWAANVGAEMTKNENVFTWEGTVGDDTYFCFTNLLADSDIDWTAIADHRFGALTDGTIVTVGNEYKVVQGEGAFKVNAGTYTFTVTFGESDIKLAVAGQAETKPDLYLVGSMTEWSESDNYKFTYDADKDEYSLTLNLTEGDEFKFKSGENWYSNTGNPLTLDEYGGTFDITDGANITVGLTEEFTFIVKGNFSSFSYTCAAAPAVKPLYLVGSFNDWTQQDPSYRFTWDEEWEEYQLTVQLTEGQELKFVDGEGNWYGNTDGQLQLTADNAQVDFDMALGGIDNNFVAAATGTYTFYVDIEYLQFYYEFEEEVFELPEVATYVEDHNFAYFEKPADWADEIYAYTWQDAGNAPVGKKKVSAAWPGDACEYVGLADNGNKVYRYVFDDDADYIIFNDNNANQTGDENFVNAGYYQVDGLKTTVPSTATAITGLNADVESGKVKAYNLQGMEVRSLSRGLYIINGKKVMIRK